MAIFDTSAGKGNELAKNVWAAVLEPQWNRKKVLHNLISGGRKDESGILNYLMTLSINGNFSVSAMADGGSIPAGGSSQNKQLSIPIAHVASTVQLSGSAVDLLKGQAVITEIDVVAREMQISVDSFLKQCNIFDWKSGTGVMANLTGTTSNPHTTNATGGNDLARFVRPGAKYDIYQSDLATSVSSLTAPPAVSSISTAGVITWTSSQAYTTAATDVVVLTNCLNAAPRGLGYHIQNSGEYFGIADRTTVPILLSYVSNESSAQLTFDKFYKLISNVKRISGEFAPEDAVCLTHYDQMEGLQKLVYGAQRYTGKVGRFDAGADAIYAHGVVIETDDDCPVGEVYLLKPSSFFLVMGGGQTAPDWMVGPDGQIWHMDANTASDGRGSQKYSYSAGLHVYYTIGCYQPNANGKLTSLSIPSGYNTWIE